MQKIAVYGGTFNPFHNGHLHLAKRFSMLLGFDRVIFIPTNVPPHKQAENLANAQDRLTMCRLAAEEFGFEVSNLEIRRQGPSYTVDTLEELKHLFPESELYLITGEDMFLTLMKWREPLRIIQLAVICAAPRSEKGLHSLEAYASLIHEKGGRTVLKNIKYLPISSTMVREAVQAGKSITGMVPPSVADYIRINHLYEELSS